MTKSRIIVNYLNEYLVLFTIGESDAKIEQIRERLSLLSKGKVNLSEKTTAIILFKLRNQKQIIKAANDCYRITDEGINALREFESDIKSYNETLNSVFFNDKDTTNRDFEKEFSDFLDREEVDKAKEVFFSVMRMAFMTGWRNSGEDLSYKKILDISTVEKNGK